MKTKNPSKQRLRVKKADLHTRLKFMGSHLAKDLKKSLNKRSCPVRVADTVKIMTGDYKKKTGKVSLVDHKNCRVYIEGIDRVKKDGNKALIGIHPSNIMITELVEDKRRHGKKSL